MNIKLNLPKRSSNELTQREFEVLQHIIFGQTSIQIADALSISRRTVDTHRKHIAEKTNCVNLVQLTLFAVRRDWIDGYSWQKG